jgi:hypothetical protein
MRALVVYESMFGNTEKIASAVAAGLAAYAEVSVREVSGAPRELDDLDLLVVGAPTNGYGLSRPQSRASAAQMASADGLISAQAGLREWLADLAETRPWAPAAAFDTSLNKPRWLVGSAARQAAKQLRRRGHPLLAQPESFHVAGTMGPLVDGELDRARTWGATIGTQASAIVEGRSSKRAE